MKGILLVLALTGLCAHAIHIPGTENGHCELDIVVLLDTSGSIKDNGGAANWDRVKNFTKQMVNAIDELSEVGTQTRIGLTSYSNRVVNDVTLDETLDSSSLMRAVDNIDFQGSITRMRAVVLNATEQLNNARDDVTRALILFTDGEPNDPFDSSETLSNVLRALRDLMDRQIYVVMVGIHNVNETMMSEIRSYSNAQGSTDFGYAERAESFTTLGSSGFSNLVVNNLRVRCEPPNPTQCGLDIFMLVDSSGSIGESVFKDNVKPFAMIIVDAIEDRFDINGGQTRMAVETFSRSFKLLLPLEEGNNTRIIKDRIDRMDYDNSWTHVVEYTEQAWNELRANGRGGVELRMVVITDGVAAHEDPRNRKENLPNLVDLIERMKARSPPVYTSIVGFEGSRPTVVISEVLEQLSEVADVTNIVRDYGSQFSIEAARDVVNRMGGECPSLDLLPLCPNGQPIDLVIVVDDTSRANFEESKRAAQHILESVRPYMASGDRITDSRYRNVHVQIVSSSQALVVGPNDDVSDLLRDMGSGDNKLLRALNMASIRLGTSFLLSGGFDRFRVVLVIHSGTMNYDTDPLGSDSMNSFKRMAFNQLKYNDTAQIHAVPINAGIHGLEVLHRLHTQPGDLLSSEMEDYDQILTATCPTDDPCYDTDVAFLLDVSGSTNMDLLKSQATSMLTFLRDSVDFTNTRVAMVTFSEYANVLVDLENGQLNDQETFDNLLSLINGLQQSPQTMSNIAYALQMTSQMVFRNHGDRRTGTDHIIIFSDGETNMVTGPISNRYAIQQAAAVVDSVFMFKPQEPIMGPYTDTSFRNHEPSMTLSSYEDVFTNSVFSARDCRPLDILCNRDLMIVFDSSGSITQDAYNKVKVYVAALIESYYERTNSGRVGAVYYSENARVAVNFANHRRDIREVVSTVNELDYKGGKTNVEGGLQTAVAEFESKGGAKETTAILLISDGESNLGRDAHVKITELKNDDYMIYAILLTPTYEEDIRNIEDAIPGDTVRVDTYDELISESADGMTYVEWALRKVCA